MKIKYREAQIIKVVLFIQGTLLLLATIFSFVSDYQQGIMDNKITEVNSRFLELMQEESSISDSRLELIEMVILRDHLKLDVTQSASLNSDLKTISDRYDKKLVGYKPDKYRESSSDAKAILDHAEQERICFTVLSLFLTVLAFLINIYAIWKISKFPLQSTQ